MRICVIRGVSDQITRGVQMGGGVKNSYSRGAGTSAR